MKYYLKKQTGYLLVVAICLMQLQFVQSDSIQSFQNLGKGIMYLKENRIIKNIRVKEIKSFWIIYEKDGNLHDKMMDEIIRIEFLDAKPSPAIMTFEENIVVVKNVSPLNN